MPRMAWPMLWIVCVLAACAATPPNVPPVQPITFQGGPTFRFAASQIEIVNEHQQTFQSPNVEHLFPTSPAAMAERWARDRLVPTGGPWRLRFVIKRAGVVEADLPRTGGIRGALTLEQAQRYDAELEVELEVRNERGFRDGVVTGRVERRQSVREDTTLADRERVWNAMIVQMARDFDAELERNVRSALTRFMVP